MIYGFIPAREGSKRLPQKNIKLLNNKSLVEHAIDASLNSKYIQKTIVSTDDPVVKKISEEKNIKCIDRKKELCTDLTSTQEVIDDFIDSLLTYTISDCIVLLQPTSPLRTSEDIDKGIKFFLDSDFDSIVSVREIAPFVYYPNGAVYVFRNKIYTDNIGFFLMSKEKSVDVDTLFDFDICTYLMDGKK